MCCVCAVWLFVTPWHVSPPGPWVHGTFQARVLEWVPFPTPGYLPDPGIAPSSLASSALAGRFFTAVPPGKPLNQAWSPSKHKTLCDHTGQKPMNTLPRTYSLVLPNQHLDQLDQPNQSKMFHHFMSFSIELLNGRDYLGAIFLFFSVLDVDHSWVFIEFVTNCLCFMVWFFGYKPYGIPALQPGIEPTPPTLESEVPTTEPPEKSHDCVLFEQISWIY